MIARLRGLAAAQQHPWGLATVHRSAALVALAGGYDEAAAAGLAGGGRLPGSEHAARQLRVPPA